MVVDYLLVEVAMAAVAAASVDLVVDPEEVAVAIPSAEDSHLVVEVVEDSHPVVEVVEVVVDHQEVAVEADLQANLTITLHLRPKHSP